MLLSSCRRMAANRELCGSEDDGNEKHKSNASIGIQPNPVNDFVSITIYANTSYPLVWQLFDIQGYSLLNGKLNSDKSIINVESLPNGIYFLKFGEAKLPVQKIVVEH